jgi:hypothetical protein
MAQDVTWEVTAVTPYTDFNAAGQSVPGKQLTISTSTGYTGTVFVPSSVLGDQGAVQEIIENEVRLVAAAKALSGTISAG